MIAKRLLPSLVTLAALVFALSFGLARAADVPAAAEDKPLVSVNGTLLTVKDLQAFASTISANRGQQLPKEEVMNTFIDRELLFQEAMAEGYDKEPDVITELANEKRSLLANYMVKQVLQDQPVTDDELRKVYKDRILSQKLNEYKARHILVKTEGEAKDIIVQLDKGGDFSALAKGKSIDTVSAEQGGDLGWFAPTQMVPEFSKAAAGLEKGQYTKTPVKSQFGWHIVMLDNVRPVTPPKFEDIRDRLESVVQNQHLTEHLNGLRKKATVEPK